MSRHIFIDFIQHARYISLLTLLEKPGFPGFCNNP